jgi:hypothetical protein
MILFQAQIQEHQDLAQHYRDLAANREALAAGLLAVQQQADSDLSSLRMLVDKCKEVAPSAITSLKTAVLGLFDSGNNDGGNPSPDPTPDRDPSSETKEDALFTPGSILVDVNGSYGIVIGTNNLGMRVDWLGLGSCPNPASGKGVWYSWAKDNQAIADFSTSTHDQVKLFSTDEFLQSQTWDKDQLDEYWDGEWVSDYGCQYRWGGATINRWIVVFTESCDWASPFASPIACLLWEDAPLLGQACVIETTPYVELVKVSDALAYQRKHDGEIICCYFGFRTKAHAQSWLHFFEAVTSAVELRQALRIEGCKWEIKAKGLGIKQIERYAKDCDFSKSYRSEVCSSKPPGYKKPQCPQPVNPDEVGEGDIVTALLTPSASYKIIQIMPNGILDCENLTTGGRLGLRATAVTLVQKGQALNESALVGAATGNDYDF